MSTLVVLTTGSSCPAGVLTAGAWRLLAAVGRVLAREDVDPAWLVALERADVEVVTLPRSEPAALAARLLADAADGTVVWFSSADDDPGLASALTRLLVERSSSGSGPQVTVELEAGSWDRPGSAVLELVSVMDTLRSPGGCPWDAEQTHESLVPYALEEAYEVAEAVETGDRVALQEELGDLLLQVAFHARVAEDHPQHPFDVDDVARGITTKLRRRHPHVFAAGSDGRSASTAAEVETSWEALKQDEKRRASVLDGVPVAMSALGRAQKVLGRIARAGLPGAPTAPPSHVTVAGVGAELLALVERARLAGVDAEAALRQSVRDAEATARAAEPGGR